MQIDQVIIENFKCYKGRFSLGLNSGLNILVGDNEEGKSTILEAIHLALTGMFHGKYVKHDLTQYLFNKEVVDEYIAKINDKRAKARPELPRILIEIYMQGDDIVRLEGDANIGRNGVKSCGISYEIAFDERYQDLYEELVKNGDIKTIPIEYYDVSWSSFSRMTITSKQIPIKSAFIDSASYRYQNGSDVYISRIIRDNLETEDIVGIAQAHRQMRDYFGQNQSVQSINSKIDDAVKIGDRQLSLSVDLSTKNAWENSLMTYLDNIPFHYLGRGEQCRIKTKLALTHKKSYEANILLLEEPESHLSHVNLNQHVYDIQQKTKDKQIIMSTHNSFVANKLGLDSLILLNDFNSVRLSDLSPDTKAFFERLAGYNTLRLILCRKAILVEGDSDELIIQKAYITKYGKLPIEDGIDVISVGTAFLRFLEIAHRLGKSVVVVTDNDGEPNKIKIRYSAYERHAKIKICFDETVDQGSHMIGTRQFNYNTLEPKLLKVNGLDRLNKIFETKYADENRMHTYMFNSKADCALKIFQTTEEFMLPDYIRQAIE